MAESSECKLKQLIRYTAPPTKYDLAPMGTLCSVLKNDEGTEQEFFVQISPDENDPVWASASEIVLERFKKEMTDLCFLLKCIEETRSLFE